MTAPSPTLFCETCHAPGRPIRLDPCDPWVLCDLHINELVMLIEEAQRDPRYAYPLNQALVSLPWHRRLGLWLLRWLRPLHVTDALIWWQSASLRVRRCDNCGHLPWRHRRVGKTLRCP